MPAIRTLDHVDSFLGPIDPVETLASCTERLFEAAETNENTAAVVRHAIDFAESRREAFKSRFSRARGENRLVTEAELDLLAVSHRRLSALMPVTGFSVPRALKDTAKSGVAPFQRFADGIEDDFFFELSMETERRSLVDATFRSELLKSRDDVTKAMKRLGHIARTSRVFQESRAARPSEAGLTPVLEITLTVIGAIYIAHQLNTLGGFKNK